MHFLATTTAVTVWFLGSAVHIASQAVKSTSTPPSRFLHDGPLPLVGADLPSSAPNPQWASTETARFSAKPANPPPPTPTTCWAKECFDVVYDFNAAYVAAGKLVEPSPGDGSKERFQSIAYQRELCVKYKYSDIQFGAFGSSSNRLDACFVCLDSAGLEVKDPQSPAMTFKWKVWNVCHTNWPNEYEVLEQLTGFMRAGKAPDKFQNGKLEMTDIIGEVSDKFTWTSGMNSPTVLPATSTTQMSTSPRSSAIPISTTPSSTTIPTSTTPPSFTFQTSTTTTSTSSSSPDPTTTSASTDPTPTLTTCWVSDPCAQFVTDIAGAYKLSGDMKDPNQRSQNGSSDQSHIFQFHFCEDSNYKDILFEGLASPDTPMYTCLECFSAAGIDTTTPSTPVQNFLWKIHDFCHTDAPSLYDLLDHLLSFMAASAAPSSFSNMPAQITALVPSLRAAFTWTDGMNRATSGPQMPWWQSALSPDAPIPTEYLAQVPRDWPYTEYGVARKVGDVTSWPFVHPNRTRVTVAWLVHSVLGNARPVWTPKEVARRLDGSVWNPGLRGWRHGFVYDTVTVTAEGTAAGARATVAEVRVSVGRTMGPVATTGVLRGSKGGVSTALSSMEMVTSQAPEETMGAEEAMKKFEELVGELEGIVKDGKNKGTTSGM